MHGTRSTTLESLCFACRTRFSAEILLLDLCQRGEITDDLFAPEQPVEAERVMNVLDQINARWGKGTLRPARVPVEPGWGMRRELMSPGYTTRWDQLFNVWCR